MAPGPGAGGERPELPHGPVPPGAHAHAPAPPRGRRDGRRPELPAQGDHAQLGHGLTTQRLKDLALEPLPPLHLIVLSHLHGDRFDQNVEQRLDRDLPIVTTGDAATRLAAKGFRATHGLQTWDALTVTRVGDRLRITTLPARHGPPVIAGLQPHTMGSLLESEGVGGGSRDRVSISGDTLMPRDLAEIPRRFPDIDLGRFHVDATTILGLIVVTLDDCQGVDAIRLIDPRTAIPTHFDDYDRFRFDMDDFRRQIAASGLAGRAHHRNRGETYRFLPRQRQPMGGNV